MVAYMLEHSRYLNIFGIFAILGICFLFSKDRKAIDYKLIAHALAVELK